MSSDQKRASGNAYEEDLDSDTEVDQMFGNDQEVEEVQVEDTNELITDHEIEQLFRDVLEVVGEVIAVVQRLDQPIVDQLAHEEVARDEQHGDEEVVGPLPAEEAENRRSTWYIQSEFNEMKLLSIRRWYRTDAAITILGPEGRLHCPPIGQIASSNMIMQCGVYLPLLPYFKRIIEYYDVSPFQLVPNVYHLMVALYLIFCRLGLREPQPKDFAWFFQIKSFINFSFYYFNKWVVEGLVKIEGIRDNNMGPFKKNFFYTPSEIAGNFREPSNNPFFTILHLLLFLF